MMNTRRAVLARLGSGAAVCGAAGCAGAGGATSSATKGAVGPATIEVAYNFTSLEQPYLEKHTQAFMQRYPQVKVNWTSVQTDDHYSKLTTMIASGTPPHMSHMVSRWAGQFIRGQKAYTDLSPLAKADKLDLKDFWPLLAEGFADEEKRPMVL